LTNSTVQLATFFVHKRIGTFDRLGSAKYNQQNNQAQSFYPYGEDRGTVEPNDALKFATYTRDAATGLDYADQRYYASNFGRFMSPDRSTRGTDGSNPGTLNSYTYVLNDPVNHRDPSGLDYCLIDGNPIPDMNDTACAEAGGQWVIDEPPPSSPGCDGNGSGFIDNGVDPEPCPTQLQPPPTPAGQKLVPTSIRIEMNANGTNRDCYTSFFNQSTGSFAERDILYGVYDQNGNFMSDVNIREILTIVSGRVCPTGTVRSGNECTGSYGDPSGGYFLDSLAASPGFGNATYTQIFQVTTLPGVQGLQGVYNLPLQIMNNYTSGGSQSNTISLTPQAITLNGNNGGMTPCGPIGHP
jgi:RHS repeat-associated protein